MLEYTFKEVLTSSDAHSSIALPKASLSKSVYGRPGPIAKQANGNLSNFKIKGSCFRI